MAHRDLVHRGPRTPRTTRTPGRRVRPRCCQSHVCNPTTHKISHLASGSLPRKPIVYAEKMAIAKVTAKSEIREPSVTCRPSFDPRHAANDPRALASAAGSPGGEALTSAARSVFVPQFATRS